MRALEIKVKAVLNQRLDEGLFENKTERLESAIDCAVTSLKSVFSDYDADIEVIRSEIESGIVHYKIKLNQGHTFSKNNVEQLKLIRSSFENSESVYYDEFLIVDYINI